MCLERQCIFDVNYIRDFIISEITTSECQERFYPKTWALTLSLH